MNATTTTVNLEVARQHLEAIRAKSGIGGPSKKAVDYVNGNPVSHDGSTPGEVELFVAELTWYAHICSITDFIKLRERLGNEQDRTIPDAALELIAEECRMYRPDREFYRASGGGNIEFDHSAFLNFMAHKVTDEGLSSLDAATYNVLATGAAEGKDPVFRQRYQRQFYRLKLHEVGIKRPNQLIMACAYLGLNIDTLIELIEEGEYDQLLSQVIPLKTGQKVDSTYMCNALVLCAMVDEDGEGIFPKLGTHNQVMLLFEIIGRSDLTESDQRTLLEAIAGLVKLNSRSQLDFGHISRKGVPDDLAMEFLRRITLMDHIALEVLMTHYAQADDLKDIEALQVYANRQTVSIQIVVACHRASNN